MSTESQESPGAEGAPPISGGMRRLLDYTTELRTSLREAEADYRKKVAALEEKLARKEAEIGAEARRASEAGEEAAKLQRALAQSNSSVARLNGELQELKSRMESLKAAEEKSQALAKSESVKAAQAAAEAKKLADELDRARAGAAELQSRLHALDQQLNDRRTAEERGMLELAKERQATSAARKEAGENLARAKALEEQNEALSRRLAELQDAARQMAALRTVIEDLQTELKAERESREKLATELEEARNSSTFERCQTLESENQRLTALANQREIEASAARKSMEEAEKIAFESRAKLLEQYAEIESKDILKSNFEKAEAELANKNEQIARLTEALEREQTKRQEIEEKVLYSSKRDNLRDSLSSLAKKRKLEDSNG